MSHTLHHVASINRMFVHYSVEWINRLKHGSSSAGPYAGRESRPFTQSVSITLNLELSRPSCVRRWVGRLHEQRKPRLGILQSTIYTLHSTTVLQSTIATARDCTWIQGGFKVETLLGGRSCKHYGRFRCLTKPTTKIRTRLPGGILILVQRSW